MTIDIRDADLEDPLHAAAVIEIVNGRIGRALLAGAEARARARGCCKLTLEVLEENHRARSLYMSFGFGDVPFDGSTSTRFLSKPLPAAGKE